MASWPGVEPHEAATAGPLHDAFVVHARGHARAVLALDEIGSLAHDAHTTDPRLALSRLTFIQGALDAL